MRGGDTKVILPSELRLLMMAVMSEVLKSCHDTTRTLRTGGSDFINNRLLVHRNDRDLNRSGFGEVIWYDLIWKFGQSSALSTSTKIFLFEKFSHFGGLCETF
jgi:hypothetical protein